MSSDITTSKNLSFDEFFSSGLEHHKQWMVMVKNPIFKTFVLTYNKHENMIRVHIFANTPEKQSPLDFIRGLIEQVDPDYYIVIGEAWAKIYDNPEKAKESYNNLRYGEISKMPDKVELLTAIGKSKDGKNETTKVFTMKRNTNEEIIELKEMKGKLTTTKLP